ncbi:MAG TPA: glycerol-3-phosphate dehydrogenase [Polyangiaceae bacterium LLY-WYZ-15_(1-7)]|nr:glycerol-3-phosphate dehydrogenase [Polyangiaceae bacterium LLY-WYZ-15_(1-7)]HJL02485.1 glycerol-3-phosphate dehydrogenase [Polyangiaceae bacterium LLY-WYZ-15_(1-7)]HJL12268.1 glycerol-3-phosphate dehydrogenase [Polyangiaceae bacterium LLY-WYZ-15_(1-7)]HJL46922.1 glycerol-3-phosphate dehydrogenase [Polyangiaceae bacterium LLY-WYZ-15_(1-7)]
MPTRREMWERLGEDVDVLVVGGGITGAGIARDAVRRGLKTALVEMNDLAYGTSSRSSKLVHGGLRYLEHYEFSMVFESVSERRILMDLAPHLVNPLGFLFPVYRGSRQNLFVINVGMWLYDGLSLFRSPKIHKNLKPAEVAELEPALDRSGLKGAPLYYDCSTDDARLTLETALDAAHEGAIVCTGAKVKRFLKDERGRVAGAAVEDTLGGEGTKEIRAKVVINATGPWTDTTRRLSSVPGQEHRDVLRPTKGIHIVVAAEKLPVEHAVVCFHPTDERVLFALPWGDRTYVGTTDTDYAGDPAKVAATAEDVDYLIDAANHYFPKHPLAREDVISTWAGLRPLIAPPEKASMSESDVSREHEILVGRDGLITIAGGKLTTYRRMAAEVVDKAVRLLKLTRMLPADLKPAKTDENPLPGGRGWPEDDDHDAVAGRVRAASQDVLSPEVARHLADNYGMQALEIGAMVAEDPGLGRALVEGRPEIMAQVRWAVERELAATVADVMVRRTQLFYRDLDQGLGCADAVAHEMARLLGWDEKTQRAMVKAYADEVALSRAWREG